ncbi:MAG: transporter [Pelagibacteraceae bacterium TMED216]|nr:MAG: transporter [Pelagibacteraceae bacterium TMED216]|tara:strand:+ start:2474 stop:3373 length:900 start_codon:yes stop_codon:yes gene_type:complete
MELYIKLIDVILPVFFVIGIGFYLGKKDPYFNTDFITTLAGNVGTPAMIFYTITSTGVTLDVFIEYFIYALIIIGGFSVIGLIILGLMKKDIVSELPPLILPNTGNMGIPICLFAYGTEGLGIASAIASVIILLHFTLGVLLAKKSFSLKILITNMPIYGIIAAVIVLYFDWKVPGYIENTTFLLTYATIFLVLMSLGVALTKLKVVSWLNASILSIVRIIIGPIIGFSLIKYLNLSGLAAGVLLIQSAMPSAILTYLVGSMYSEKRVVDNIASVIVMSTLMSFITIPIVVYFCLKYFQ